MIPEVLPGLDTWARTPARVSLSRFRRSSISLAVMRLRGTLSMVGDDSGALLCWPTRGTRSPEPSGSPPGCGICDAAAAGLTALGFQTSEARAAGFIELGLLMSEGAALGLIASGCAPPSFEQ